MSLGRSARSVTLTCVTIRRTGNLMISLIILTLLLLPLKHKIWSLMNSCGGSLENSTKQERIKSKLLTSGPPSKDWEGLLQQMTPQIWWKNSTFKKTHPLISNNSNDYLTSRLRMMMISMTPIWNYLVKKVQDWDWKFPLPTSAWKNPSSLMI